MKHFINCLVIYLVTIGMVHGNLPPTTLKGQAETAKPTNFNFEVPNYQSIQTSASARLIDTGNSNELQNAGFEHSTVTTGWTVSNATASGSASAIEGKKALSLALTGALSLSQSSTINAAQKSGVQMVASVWVNSSDVSDLQLCSLKNGAEDKCTVTGGYVQGSGWRQLTVSFLGDSTSNGLKLKSTDTTGTVLVDQAYVGIGSPIVDFTPDMVYSAKVSAVGVVTGENTDWINGSCSTSTGSQNFSTTCNFVSNIFTVAPNCLVSLNKEFDWTGGIQSVTSSSVSYTVSSVGSGSAGTDVYLICQKQGADYKTSKAYVASSSDADWAPCTFSTLAWQGLGSVTSNLLCSRKGSSIKIKGRVTLGTVSSSQAQIPLPTNFGTITTASNIPSTSYASGFVLREAATPNSIYSLIQLPSVSYLAMGGQLGNTTINPNAPLSGSAMFSNGDVLSIPEISIPIQGWADANVIVGSFQGYNETPGVSRPFLYSVSIGGASGVNSVCNSSPCTIYNNFTNGLVTGVSRTSQGSYNITTSTSINNYNCFVKASRNIGMDCEISSVSGTNNSVACRDYATPNAQDTSFTLYCHGSL